jgi:eukaryotic-like serine/threonine-protein kinase
VTGPASDPISARWSEVDRLFGQALGLAVAEREAFLTRTCADDPELHSTLSRLLAASSRAEEALSGPNPGFLRAALGRAPDENTVPDAPFEPRMVGPYRLVRELKRGGMATVYEAERSDGAFSQRVALKMLRGSDSDDLSRRFLAEREILSSFAHPNIAPILDGGTAPDGRHYLVMEFVEGEPITRWADARKLDVRGRLDLFRQVAHAVHYAHARLVVHRDLKPSNVLVDAEGRVRLLDFGIAKILDPGSGPGGDDGSDPTTRWMTPEYAAPEQILGEAPGTPTDVHGLGLLLHELLTGQRPFSAEGRSGFEVQRAIFEEVPVPMSARVEGDPDAEARAARRGTTPVRLRRALAGDLDAVVARALRKIPAERYPSADALADDVDRYLAGLPVVARRGRLGYRARKFVRRHRVGVAAVAGVMLLLVSSSLLLARQGAETARERDRAETEAERARLVTGFLSDIFQGPDPTRSPGDTVTALELLDWGVDRVEREFVDRPALQADLFQVLGDAYAALGLPDAALEVREAGLEATQTAFGPTSLETAQALERLAGVHNLNRDPQSRVEALTRAVEIHEGLPPEQNDEVAFANALSGLSGALRDVGQPDSAEFFARRAVELLDRHPDQEQAHTSSLLGLAFVLRAQDRLDEAADIYEEAIPRYRAFDDMDAQTLATYLNNLGYLRRVEEDFRAADTLYRESVRILESELGPGHPTARMHRSNWASVLHEQGRFDETEALLRQNLSAAQEQWPEGHWRVGSAHAALGTMFFRQGRTTEAEAMARSAAMIYEAELGPNHDWTSFQWAKVAAVRVRSDDPEAGQLFLDRLHRYLAEERAESNALPMDRPDLIRGLLEVLETLELPREHERFAALLEPTSSP